MIYNEEGRLKTLSTLKEGINESYEINAVSFAFLSEKYPEDSKEEAYQALVKSTKELCAYAKSKGSLKITLEVFDYDIDKKPLIGPVSLAKRFSQEITKEYTNFGLLVDLSHIPMLSETVKKGEWTNNRDWCYWNYPLIELAGKTMDIIGYGRIGQATGKIAQAMGMNVLAYDEHQIQSLESHTMKYASMNSYPNQL